MPVAVCKKSGAIGKARLLIPPTVPWPNAAHTWVAGSSMGGLISLWAVLQYSKIFGGAGILSPSLWIAPQVKKDAATLLKRYTGKLFFYAGGMESAAMITDMDTVIRNISMNSKTQIVRRVEDGAGTQ